MEYIITIIVSYLIGCSHMSFYIEKMKGIKIKEQGSKNYGASNTVALAGWKAGIFVALHDVGKAVLAVMLLGMLFTAHKYIPVIAGVSCIMGHIFPFYLKFDGGKGFASYVGMTLAINWKLGLAVLILILVVTLLTDYIVAGTFSTIAAVPVVIGMVEQDILQVFILGIATIVILLKHKQNIINLYKGTEMKVSAVAKKKS